MLLVGYFPAITISGTLSGCLPGRKTWLTSRGVKKQDSSEKFLGEHQVSGKCLRISNMKPVALSTVSTFLLLGSVG